jgi:hypothetical protein
VKRLWQQLEGFADYAFNKSHAVAYSLLAYQTAYLKAHYPTYFYAAVLSNELNNTDKVVKYINRARARGIEILPPDVNMSREGFTPLGGKIRFGLAAIKGLGIATVQAIIAAREAGGPFRSLFDFAARVDPRVLNRRVLESLIKAGAFDSLGANRHQLFAAVERALEYGARRGREREIGQFDLFAASAPATAEGLEPTLPDLPEWPLEERLAGEKETLGFYVTGHPLEKYAAEIAQYTDVTTEQLFGAGIFKDEASNGDLAEVESESESESDGYPTHSLDRVGTPEGAPSRSALMRSSRLQGMGGSDGHDCGHRHCSLAQDDQARRSFCDLHSGGSIRFAQGPRLARDVPQDEPDTALRCSRGRARKARARGEHGYADRRGDRDSGRTEGACDPGSPRDLWIAWGARNACDHPRAGRGGDSGEGGSPLWHSRSPSRIS